MIAEDKLSSLMETSVNCESKSYKIGPGETFQQSLIFMGKAGNTKGGSITVPLTSCLTGLD
jgi:hypothetical protein